MGAKDKVKRPKGPPARCQDLEGPWTSSKSIIIMIIIDQPNNPFQPMLAAIAGETCTGFNSTSAEVFIVVIIIIIIIGEPPRILVIVIFVFIIHKSSDLVLLQDKELLIVAAS